MKNGTAKELMCTEPDCPKPGPFASARGRNLHMVLKHSKLSPAAKVRGKYPSYRRKQKRKYTKRTDGAQARLDNSSAAKNLLSTLPMPLRRTLKFCPNCGASTSSCSKCGEDLRPYQVAAELKA